MTATEIVDRLAERHSKDVFVPECKDGPTYAGSHLRLDAWAMNRSWANFCTYGYEVKVTRSDFIRDDKMQRYLPLCNLFYVVCPVGLIAVEEVPDGAGLMVASPNHRRLLVKKKATYREVADPTLVYRYILMCRAKIEREDYMVRTHDSNVRFWTAWLAERDTGYDLGQRVSKALAKLIKEKITTVAEENDRLKKENEHLAEVRSLLEKVGITRTYGTTWGLREKLEAYKKGYPDELRHLLDAAEGSARSFMRSIEEIKKELSKDKGGTDAAGSLRQEGTASDPLGGS